MSARRNVIVIMTDSFQSSHLGCYGNNWMRTPNPDRFAREVDFISDAAVTTPDCCLDIRRGEQVRSEVRGRGP